VGKFDAGSASSGPGVLGTRGATGTDLTLEAPDGNTNLLAIWNSVNEAAGALEKSGGGGAPAGLEVCCETSSLPETACAKTQAEFNATMARLMRR
jgi:hypothetical protein